ncbi:PAS domain-containing protein [Spirosoma pomorum]
MFDLSSASWCDTFAEPPSRPTLASFEFIPRPVRLPASCQPDFQQFMRLAHRAQWQFDYRQVAAFMHNPQHALLVTDLGGQIQFINQGFVTMTGYDRGDVLGRRPDFLQGTDTSAETRQAIRDSLRLQQPFEGSLINYRKSGEAYWCTIQITPLFTADKELTHFMAFEWEN